MSFEVPSIHVDSKSPELPSVRLLPTSIQEAKDSGHFPLPEDITQFFGPAGDSEDFKSAEAFYQWSIDLPDTTFAWGIHAGDDDTYIGNASIWYFAGTDPSRSFPNTSLFITHPSPEFRGRRYGLAANLALAHYAFEAIGTYALVAHIDPPNAPSFKMHEKMGYVFDSPPAEGDPLYRYVLLRPDYTSQPNFGDRLQQTPTEALAKARNLYCALASLVDIKIVA